MSGKEINYYNIFANKANHPAIKDWIECKLCLNDVDIERDVTDSAYEIYYFDRNEGSIYLMGVHPKTPCVLGNYDGLDNDEAIQFKDFLYKLTREGKIESLKEL